MPGKGGNGRGNPKQMRGGLMWSSSLIAMAGLTLALINQTPVEKEHTYNLYSCIWHPCEREEARKQHPT
jgi:hypothetical protein